MTQGISMTLDQFSSLIKLLPEIEQAVQQHGESLPRPAYTGAADQNDAEDDEGQGEAGNIASPSKQNIDATSDEDSDS
jgi:hypothetical protein